MGGREGERGREREGGVIMHDIINNNKYKCHSLLNQVTHVHAEYNVHINNVNSSYSCF